MSIRCFAGDSVTRSFILAAALGVWILGASASFGQFSSGAGMGGGGMGGGGGGGMDGRHAGGADQRSGPSDYYRGKAPPPSQTVLTLHGGQYLKTASTYCEVVFMPLQARIYVYDKLMKPISAQPLRAQMSLQVPGERERQHLSFQCVVMPQGVAEQNYLVASFDFGRLPDKDIPITVEFSNLPDWRHPTASFTPLFSLSQIRPYVTEVQLTKADYDGVTRQRVCPVTGDVLGSKGQVVKLLIGDYPLYVCCQDCLDAVRQRPEKYLPQMPAGGR